MRRWLVLVMVIAMVPAALYGKGYEVKGRAGQYHVEAVIDPNPPVRGSNELEIFVTDAASRPVSDADVQVEYLMPTLPGKKPMMDYTGVVEPHGKGYRAVLDLSMAGEWTVVIKITHMGKTGNMKFTFEVK
jgi:hypothetical protein